MLKAVLSFCLLLSAPAHAQDLLAWIERVVQSNFPVASITWQDLQSASRDSVPWVVFDTRSALEYQTSHICGAVHVDPQLSATDFVEIYADSLRGKHAVFYCSVGYRSSLFVQRVQRAAEQAGARSVTNLRGGIFRWYNAANPVFNAQGETAAIHPYNSFWRFLLRARNHSEAEGS